MGLKAEFIFEEAPVRSCHASTIVETAQGDLVSAWFGGKAEGEPDVGIWLSRRDSSTWTPPVKVAAAHNTPCWNPVLHQLRGGPLLLFYKAGPSPQAWSGLVMRSTDGGKSWSSPEQLPAGILGPIKNKPFELPDGTLVCGSSVESYQVWGCWVERTSDAGRTWTKHGPINLPNSLHGIIQPAIFGGADGKLAMLCRSRGTHRMARAITSDAGRTWSQATGIDLPQNNSGLDAVRLRDGRVVLVYNHTTGPRSPLNVAVSGDMGVTWKSGPVLEHRQGEFSYPAVIQASDGTVHVTYTWDRKRIKHVTLLPNDLPRI